MLDPALSTNFVSAAALRRYNFFKFAVLLLLLALLLGLLFRQAQYSRIDDPTISGPAGTLAAGAIAFNGTGTPGSAIDVRLDGVSVGATTVDSQGNWALNTNLERPGRYDFQALASDPDGVIRGRSSTLSLEIPGPIEAAGGSGLVYLAPTLAGPAGAISGRSVTLSGTGTPGSTVALFANGNSAATTKVAEDGTWSAAVAAPALRSEFVALGYEPDGREIGASNVLNLFVPAAAAALILDVPELTDLAGNASQVDGSFAVGGAGEPESIVRLYVVDAAGQEVELGSAPVDRAGRWHFADKLSLPAGRYTLQATMIWPDGAELGRGRSVGLDISAPERASIDIDGLNMTERGENTYTVDLIGTAEPGATVAIYVDRALVDQVDTGANGSWRVSLTLPEGIYELAAGYDDLALEEGSQWAVAQKLVVGEPSGTLTVAYGGEGRDDAGVGLAPAGSPGIHIILDASWSMTQPLDGSTRFEVARETVANIVNKRLPAGTPVTMRMFGNRQGNLACQTDLMIPYGELNRASFNGVLLAERPQFNANTALAASLAAVPSDLVAAADQAVIVVLLTDGQESCGGDPAAEIAALGEAGFDVVVNIVGLSIVDEALEAQFRRWAELGHGAYFAADDAETLAGALADAMRVGYVVRDAGGNVVAEGRVGGAALALPAGDYSVEVRTAPPIIITDVVIAHDQSTAIALTE